MGELVDAKDLVFVDESMSIEDATNVCQQLNKTFKRLSGMDTSSY